MILFSFTKSFFGWIFETYFASKVYIFANQLKYMKKYFLIVALTLITLGKTFAMDNKSDSILKAVSAKYKSFKTYKASFAYNLENKKDKINITKKGTIYVKGLKFKIEMGNLEIFCDGKTIWKYNKEDNEVEINTFNAVF